MTPPKTLLELAGAPMAPASLDDAALVIIDMQNEYLQGPIAVDGAQAAVTAAGGLLQAARMAGTPIFHVAHKGRPGSLFDRDQPRGQIVDALAPAHGESLIEKGLPNAFAGTDLANLVNATGKKELILCGFMTHMCVSSTARAGLDLGFRVTIDADACGTRALPDGQGGALDAATIHNVALAELSDRFAIIARNHDWAA